MKLSHKITALLAACAMLLPLTGCGENPLYYRYDYDLSDYITLAEYKNLPASVSDNVLTDEEVQQEIMSTVMYFAQITEVDRASKDGDTVKFSCTATLDGTELAELAETEGSLMLGFANYGASVEKALTGVKAGDTVKADRLMDGYTVSEDLYGKTVQYTFQITGVYETIQPTYDDTFVKMYFGYDTVAEYEESVRATMEATAELNRLTEKVVQTWPVVVENTEVIKYPEKELQEITNQLIADVEAYTSAAGVDLGEYTQVRYGLTEEEFRASAADLAKVQMKQDMIIYAIARAEKLKITDEQYTSYAELYMSQMGFGSVEELESRYTRGAICEGILGDLVKECVADYAAVTAAE